VLIKVDMRGGGPRFRGPHKEKIRNFQLGNPDGTYTCTSFDQT